MERVKNKVALITGAASGLGLASAKKLLEHGAKVFLSDINQDGLDKLTEDLKDYSGDQYSIGFHDVTSEDSWQTILARVDQKFQQLKI